MHIWELKANYGRKVWTINAQCVYQKRILQNVWMEQRRQEIQFERWNNERGKEWREIVDIYRKNKENRLIDNVGEKQNIIEE